MFYLIFLLVGGEDFGGNFENRTMRLDFFHVGTASEEHFALDQIVNDGPWAGNPNHMLDTLNRGKYFFQVQKDGKSLYSRGFSSIYGEWETTDEATQQWGTFHESMRFPWPKGPVQVVLQKRDDHNQFQTVWTVAVDPAARNVNPKALEPIFPVIPLLKSGDPHQKVDLLVLGDGYTASEQAKFKQDAERMAGYLFDQEPYKSRKSDFNVWAIGTVSQESGVSHPHAGKFTRTDLSTQYSTFDSERYVLCRDNRRLRDVASAAPYEFLLILVNNQNYGGGGIFGAQATASVNNTYSDYLFVHEFGHHFADLGDEYYTSQVSYNLGPVTVEPWEPNLTALLDPNQLKWKDLVAEGTPLPTPWPKETFESHSMEVQKKRAEMRKNKVPEKEMEALFDGQREFETKLLGEGPHAGVVGAFEGAGYRGTGYYRPQADCIMFTRDKVGFCKVCQRAISQIIDQYSR